MDAYRRRWKASWRKMLGTNRRMSSIIRQTSMDSSARPSSSVIEYFKVLRIEITEAQKLRVQVGLAKVVFLGSLFGFFLKDPKMISPGILICPFVALMFDCMVYGLSFNIREIGFYIGDEFEREMKADHANIHVTFWQTYRRDRPYVDWGRLVYRVGSYGLSAGASILSFVGACYPVLLVPRRWLWSLGVILFIGWTILILLEFGRKGPQPLQADNPPRQLKPQSGRME